MGLIPHVQMKQPPTPSKTEMRVIRVLSARPGAHGLDIAKHGKIGRGTIYVTLGRMEEKGLIQSKLETIVRDDYKGIARRQYWLTAAGTRTLPHA